MAPTIGHMNWREFEHFLLRIRSEPRPSTYKSPISGTPTDLNYPPDLLFRCTRDLPLIYGRLLSHYLPAKTGHSTFTVNKTSPVKVPLKENGWKRLVQEFIHVALSYITPFDLLRKLFDFTDTEDIVRSYINVLLEPILEENELDIYDNVPVKGDGDITMIPDYQIMDRKTGKTLGVMETKGSGSVVKASVTECMQLLLDLRRKELKETKICGPLFGIVTDALHFIFIKLQPDGQFEFEKNKCGQLKVHRANTWDDLDEIAAMINGLCRLRKRRNVNQAKRSAGEESRLLTRKGNSPLEEIKLPDIQASLEREYPHGYITVSQITSPHVDDENYPSSKQNILGEDTDYNQVPNDGTSSESDEVSTESAPTDADDVEDYQVSELNIPVEDTEFYQAPNDGTASESDEDLQVSKENVAAEDIQQVPKENLLEEVTRVQIVSNQGTPAEYPREIAVTNAGEDQQVFRKNILAQAVEDYPGRKENIPENALNKVSRFSKHSPTYSHDDSAYNSKQITAYNHNDSASSIKHNTTYNHNDSASSIKHNTTYNHNDSASSIKHNTTYNHNDSASSIKHNTTYNHNDSASSIKHSVAYNRYDDSAYGSLCSDASLLSNKGSVSFDGAATKYTFDDTDSSAMRIRNIHSTQVNPTPAPSLGSLGFSPGDYIPSKAGIPEGYTPHKIDGMYVCAVKGCYQAEQYLNTMYTHIRRYHTGALQCIPCRNLYYSAEGIKKHMNTKHDASASSSVHSSTFNSYDDISSLISISQLSSSTPVKPTAVVSMISPGFSPGDYIHTKAGVSSSPEKMGGMHFCPHCSHAEKYLNTLYTHIRRAHSGPLVCFCGKQYYSAQGLKQHMKNKH